MHTEHSELEPFVQGANRRTPGAGEEVPTQIDRFVVRECLAQGGTSRVYRAFDPQRGAEIALKVLHRRFANDAGQRLRFEREAQAVAHLQHPNIVRIFDWGGTPERYLYLAMELLDGPDLGSLVGEYGPMPRAILTGVAHQLALALGHAHEHGIIHRDLKPENVFLHQGRVVLADFGIVKAIHMATPLGPAAASPTTAIIGTPGYMAPEQIEQKPLDERTDWFSYGALLYVLASAVMPFRGSNAYVVYRTIKTEAATALSQRRTDIPTSLSDLVATCLSFDRGRRPNASKVVLSSLRRTFAEIGVGDPTALLQLYQRAPGTFSRPPVRDTEEIAAQQLMRADTVVDESAHRDTLSLPSDNVEVRHSRDRANSTTRGPPASQAHAASQSPAPPARSLASSTAPTPLACELSDAVTAVIPPRRARMASLESATTELCGRRQAPSPANPRKGSRRITLLRKTAVVLATGVMIAVVAMQALRLIARPAGNPTANGAPPTPPQPPDDGSPRPH